MVEIVCVLIPCVWIAGCILINLPYTRRMKKKRNLKLLGQRIRLLREEKKYSQEYFANMVEMNRGYFGSIERGEANVTLLNLLRIAKGLEVSLDYLFTKEVYVDE